MKLTIAPESSDTTPKSGFEKILDFFNSIETNHPIAIAEIVEKTGFSWSFVKKTLKKLKEEDYCGFNFEKSGNTWIAWKDRDRIIKNLEDTCGRLLK